MNNTTESEPLVKQDCKKEESLEQNVNTRSQRKN